MRAARAKASAWRRSIGVQVFGASESGSGLGSARSALGLGWGVDEMVDVGGRRLRVVQAGKLLRGRLPVVFEAGLTATAGCWTHVQQELAKVTRTLAYDRAGLGKSDPSSEAKDAESIAADLHRLVGALSFSRPFVLAGHSMGGIFSRAYAAKYPDDVAAMALVDASHPEQLERSPNINQALRRFFRFAKGGARTPLNAAQFGASGTEVSDRHVIETMREAESWFTSAGEVKELELGEMPLLTITAPEKAVPGWMELQNELAGLSSRSRHVVVEGASHVTILTKPEFARRVAEEIGQLIERSPSPLPSPDGRENGLRLSGRELWSLIGLLSGTS